MCGRLACSLKRDEVPECCKYTCQDDPNSSNESEKEVKPVWINLPNDYTINYNLPPTCTIPALISREHLSNTPYYQELPTRVLVPMRFGMLVTDSSGETVSNLHTHNCRLDNLMTSRLYSPKFKSGMRCVVVCSGYYEWQISSKQPYFIHSKLSTKYFENGEKLEEGESFVPLYLAGIFSKSVLKGVESYSCSILTTESDESLSWLHDRMPLVLETDEQIDKWLDFKQVPFLKSLEYLQPPKDLAWYKVDRSSLSNTRISSKNCVKNLELRSSTKFFKNWLKP